MKDFSKLIKLILKSDISPKVKEELILFLIEPKIEISSKPIQYSK